MEQKNVIFTNQALTNLLIDSSSSKVEFGYSDGTKLIFSMVLEKNFNAEALTYFVKEAFGKYRIDIGKLEYVTLSNGPGSFTGLRIGSAIAKGICYSAGSRLIEVSSLDVIANKLKQEGNITSMIFSNSKTLEFYHCSYEFVRGRLERRSEYRTGILEEILKLKSSFVINEKTEGLLPESMAESIIDVSNLSSINSLSELAGKFIAENKYSDFTLSEPFYMKEFIPKN